MSDRIWLIAYTQKERPDIPYHDFMSRLVLCPTDGWKSNGFHFCHIAIAVIDPYTYKSYSYDIRDIPGNRTVNEDIDKEFKNSKFAEPSILALKCDPKKRMKMIKWLKQRKKKKDTYDEDMWKHFIPIIGGLFPKKPNTWYCSELVAQALIIAGVFGSNFSVTITPQQLYDICKPFGTVAIPDNLRKYIKDKQRELRKKMMLKGDDKLLSL